MRAIASSLDGARGIRGFVVPIITYSATLHTGCASFKLIDGMVLYLGNQLTGGTYFLTMILLDRSALLFRKNTFITPENESQLWGGFHVDIYYINVSG